MTSTTEQNSKRNLLPCSFKFHEFVAKITDINIVCQIIKMKDSLFLWVGDCNNSSIDDLSFALLSNLDKQPIATKIMGTVEKTTSLNMARRLTMKIEKPVYISFNVIADNITLLGIEKRIQEEFKTHKDLLGF